MNSIESTDGGDCDNYDYATLEQVDWYINKHVLESIGYIPPVEPEQSYYQQGNDQAMAA